MEERILFVDDEENLLSALRRQLRNKYSFDTATNGAAGLEMISIQGPYAVVVADLRMPGMDGIQFLRQVREISPETVRMMLSGHADLQKTIEAVNEGNIFRFLTKPCPPEILIQGLESCLFQYRLITSEKVLLEQTLKQSVRLLTEVLSTVSPESFGLTLRIRQIVHRIVEILKLTYAWEVELAALLSQIGCVVLPRIILEKVKDNELLTSAELKMFQSHPSIGYRLLNSIPRLDNVALMVKDQYKSYSDIPQPSIKGKFTSTEIGAHILHIAIEYDKLLRKGNTHYQAVYQMSNLDGVFNPEILALLAEQQIQVDDWSVKTVDVKSLKPGMVLSEDVYSKDGEIIASQSQLVTIPIFEWLKTVAETRGVVEPFRVSASIFPHT